ncbi:glutathione hydrolase 6-like [Hyposmocoma kahamanoa]|uniref:glutathione hydrolase 6-like n=1 Tax=Hyposmocoma kahamanoa TaxID=1477025 RepID=UPI000E6D90AE|nr:glutathione hydrolase 6-like [Hyposmocoma kahamanoa]
MQANSSDMQPPPGVVELREDVPLKAGTSMGADSGSQCCGGGPRFILACFAVLSVGITLALMTQIYYGEYEVIPHGSVSSSAAQCSRAGTDALKAGGRAMDAAVVAALCLAVLAPHRTSLDSSGSLLYWEYRTSHNQAPLLAEWGGPNPLAKNDTSPPRALAALAWLHSNYGVLPWSRVLQPAIDIARNGFNVSDGLSAAIEAQNGKVVAPGTPRNVPDLAKYLESLQANSSSELAKFWDSEKDIARSSPHGMFAGSWKMYAGGMGAAAAGAALASALQPPIPDPNTGFQKAVISLQQAAMRDEWPPIGGVATGLAVVDRFDTYIALVMGLSKPFGTGSTVPEGFFKDEPTSPLDLAPAIIVDEHTCGTRYIIGAESSSALAQGAVSLLTAGTGSGAVEQSRVSVYAGGVLGIEATKEPPEELPMKIPPTLVNATKPYPAVNVVLQIGDQLQSHADSRGGGLASRF